jgi:hypothetical protein
LQAEAIAAVRAEADERAAQERAGVDERVTQERAAAEERAAVDAAEIAVGEIVDDAPALPDLPEAAPLELAPPRDVTAEIEQRVKETIELSLYLADQIESFDKVIANLGDLPTRLEGVVSQALKRTLAARAKLDREAEMALDEVVATLDEHVGTVGDLASTAEGVRELAAGQSQIANNLRALAEAIDRSFEGRAPRAASSIAKKARRFVPEDDLPPARTKTKKAAPRKPTKAKTSKGRTENAAGRARRKTSPRRTPGTDYIDIDGD